MRRDKSYSAKDVTALEGRGVKNFRDQIFRRLSCLGVLVVLFFFWYGVVSFVLDVV